MQRVRWRWVLPIVQVLLAIWLMQLGKAQEREFREAQGPEFLDSPGYVPPAHQWVLAVNTFPALMSAPTVILVPGGRLAFLPATFVFWWWMGWLVDTRKRSPRVRARPRAVAGAFGIAVSLTLGAMVWHSYWGHTPFTHFWSLMWCIGLTIYSTQALLSAVREIKAPNTA